MILPTWLKRPDSLVGKKFDEILEMPDFGCIVGNFGNAVDETLNNRFWVSAFWNGREDKTYKDYIAGIEADQGTARQDLLYDMMFKIQFQKAANFSSPDAIEAFSRLIASAYDFKKELSELSPQ